MKANRAKVVAGRGSVLGCADASRLRRALAVAAKCIVKEILVFVEQRSADQEHQMSKGKQETTEKSLNKIRRTWA